MNYSTDEYKAMLDLFHTIPEYDIKDRSVSFTKTSELFVHGIIVVNQSGVVMDYIPSYASRMAMTLFGTDNEIWSEMFHKTWEAITDTPIEVLAMQQAMHYFSTYGFEALGLNAMPLIPAEEIMTDPATVPNIKAFTVIRVVPEDMMWSIVKGYLYTVKAPHRNRIAGIIDLMNRTDADPEKIVSFEVKCARYDQLNTVPRDGQDFLRYVIYRMNDSTLLIKDRETIFGIKSYCRLYDDGYFYLSKCDEVEMAKIFYRYKPLILAFKADKKCAPIVNRIRRLAVKYHKPVSGFAVANLTDLVGQNRLNDAYGVIARADNKSLIKVMNYCASELNRTNDVHIYNIRNGKAYVNAESKSNAVDRNEWLFKACATQLVQNCRGKLVGKVFVIPPYVNYKVPVSEKQMVGNIPYGSSVYTETESGYLTVAIAWENYNDVRTDIDLHLSSTTKQFGWNAMYRSDGNDIVFSGDMTDAKNGAAEAFRFKADDDTYMATVNLYNGEANAPFKFLITDTEIDNANTRKGLPPVDVADAIFPAIPLQFNGSPAMTLGYLKDHEFVFYGGDLGGRIVPTPDLYADALSAIQNRCNSMLDLGVFLQMCGASVIPSVDVLEGLTDKTMKNLEVIDLSPASLTASTLTDLVD